MGHEKLQPTWNQIRLKRFREASPTVFFLQVIIEIAHPSLDVCAPACIDHASITPRRRVARTPLYHDWFHLEDGAKNIQGSLVLDNHSIMIDPANMNDLNGILEAVLVRYYPYRAHFLWLKYDTFTSLSRSYGKTYLWNSFAFQLCLFLIAGRGDFVGGPLPQSYVCPPFFSALYHSIVASVQYLLRVEAQPTSHHEFKR